MRFMKRIVMLLFLSVMVCTLSAQEKKGETIGERIVANAYNADSIRGILDKMPYFTLFKDNYFVGGTTLGHKPTAANSDVKFQLSIAQRLTKSKLPFDTYLFIQYTQKAFWNVFQESLPMKDLNFNPGIGLGHLIVYNNKYIGVAYSNNDKNCTSHIKLYDFNGKMLMENDTAIAYNSIEFDSNNEVCVTGDTACEIYTIHGVKKFYHTFDNKLYKVMYKSGMNNYIFIYDGAMDEVRLK